MLEASTIKEHSSDSTRIIRCDDYGNLCASPIENGLPTQFFLTGNGNGTGTVNLAQDFSAAPFDAYYLATVRYDIYTLAITISDNANFNQVDFGAIAGGLTNGVKFFARVGVTDIPLLSTSLRPIKKNYEWLAITPHTILTTFAGTSQTLTVDFNVMDEYGKPFTLLPDQRLICRLNDNLSTLVDFTVGVRGIRFV